MMTKGSANTGEASKSVTQGVNYVLYGFHRLFVGVKHDAMCDKTSHYLHDINCYKRET